MVEDFFDKQYDYSKMSTDQLLEYERRFAAETARLNSIQMALKICLNCWGH